VVNLTLYSYRYDDYALRRMAEALVFRLQAVVVSTFFALFIVPMVYYMAYGKKTA